ncbi:MAG: hypothetical protein Q7S42_03340 [Candidatus Omnitrophota bacterium]|nr:hypothetical protein [Candidatus Omnitrophota bacterium]
MRRGQTTLDYILLIGAVAAGLIVMLVYISRGHQGNLRSQADQLSAGQYAPGNTTIINNIENKTLASTATSGSTTTVTHGNINKQNKELEDKLKVIISKWEAMYKIRQEWEELAVPEALEGARAFRAGNFNWSSSGLDNKYKDLDKAKTELDTLSEDYANSANAWGKRVITKDKTRSGGSTSSESGTTGIHKETSETLGDL